MLTFNFHIGDFAKKTMHLTHEERGIYLSLLMRYYDTEKPLPADRESVARLVCARNADALRMVCDVLAEFFELQDDGWHNARADQEVEAYQKKSDKARKSAKARWNAASRQSEGKNEGEETQSDCNADAMRTQCEGNANHEPLTTNHTTTPYSPPDGEHCNRDGDVATQEVETSNPVQQDQRDEAFDLFWSAGMKKTNKRKARAAFRRMCGSNPMEFAQRLHEDVKARLAAEQFGFDRMHPTTYLNGERWNDEISKGSSEQRHLSPVERVQQALSRAENDEGCGLGMVEDDGAVWGQMDARERGGAYLDLEPGDWQEKRG